MYAHVAHKMIGVARKIDKAVFQFLSSLMEKADSGWSKAENINKVKLTRLIFLE